MLPKVINFVDEFPLTANGKVDRKAISNISNQESDKAEKSSVEHNLQTHLSERIADIWAQVGVQRPEKMSDDFFALGGSSLTALRAANLLNKYFESNIPVATLFSKSTVAYHESLFEKFNVLDQGFHEKRAQKLVFRTGSETIVWIHPVGGGGLCYRELADKLPECYGVVAITAPEEPSAIPKTIEEIARSYCALISEAFRDQTIHLGGWSLGGVVASEMTRQLNLEALKNNKKCRVSSLHLIDSYISSHDGPSRDNRELGFFRDLLSLNVSDLEDLDVELSDNVFEDYISILQKNNQISSKLDLSYFKRAYERYIKLSDALIRFHDSRISDVNCPVLSIRAHSELVTSDLKQYNVPANCNEVLIDGNHYSIMKNPDLTRVIREFVKSSSADN